VEDGAAHPVDPAHAVPRQRAAVGRDGSGIVRVDLEHALPAAPEADHLPAQIVGGQGDRTDAGIEPGHIAAAGQNSDLHLTPVTFRNAVEQVRQ
jgi:hypothetical protein